MTNPKVKTITQLKELLQDKMIDLETGGWKNPFCNGSEEIVHAYKSRAVDAAVKYFTSASFGEERRIKHLGKEWKNIT